jgi:hypothetical protein
VRESAISGTATSVQTSNHRRAKTSVKPPQSPTVVLTCPEGNPNERNWRKRNDATASASGMTRKEGAPRPCHVIGLGESLRGSMTAASTSVGRGIANHNLAISVTRFVQMTTCARTKPRRRSRASMTPPITAT